MSPAAPHFRWRIGGDDPLPAFPTRHGGHRIVTFSRADAHLVALRNPIL